MNSLFIRNECAHSSLQPWSQTELIEPIYVQNGAVPRKYDTAGRSVSIKRRKYSRPPPSSALHSSAAWCCHQFSAGYDVRKHILERQGTKGGGGGLKHTSTNSKTEKEGVTWSRKTGSAVIVSFWPLQVPAWYSIQSSCSDRMCCEHRDYWPGFRVMKFRIDRPTAGACFCLLTVAYRCFQRLRVMILSRSPKLSNRVFKKRYWG